MTAADLAFVGGSALRPDQAVAVADGRIVALGDAEVRAKIGSRTEVIDLAGRLLIPGFQDAHVHPIQGGLELAACELSRWRTAADYLTAIGEYARANPDLRWITGGGWSMEAFPGGAPTRQLLDRVVADRPVYLPNRDHHGAWVNSRALALAGISGVTPDPPDGRIERDEYGEPTGMLQEGAAELVGRLVPRPDSAQLSAALWRAQALLHSYGITAWQDALVGTGLNMPDVLDTYLDADASGRLTARVRAALWWHRSRGVEQLDELRARRERAAGARRLQASTVKMMLDGIAENQTAAMLSPYLDGCGAVGCSPNDPAHTMPTSGLSFIDPQELGDYVTALEFAGFQVHFHSLGDRAVRDALNAVAAARRAHRDRVDQRHLLAHLQVIHPDDIARFAALGVGANMQPLWAAHEPQMDELAIPVLGPERAGWQYPFEGLREAGARLVAGSDWPVSSVNPIDGIHVAVNRQLPGETGPVFLPEQRLSLASALRSYTAGSAWANGLDEAGEIRVGALADLAVLDRDPFAAPSDEIAATRVLQTFVGGERVYAAADA